MRHPMRLHVLACAALGLLFLSGCTSPNSVRSLSESQAQRLDQFSQTLHTALDVARDDRKFRLHAAIAMREVEITEATDPDFGPLTPQKTAKAALAKEQKAELELAVIQIDSAYASLTDYVDRVLIPANTALDGWHHRWGVSFVDSDSVASWAQTISTQGISTASLADLKTNLKSETDDEFSEVKKELKNSIDLAQEAKSLASDVSKEMQATRAVIEDLKQAVEDLKAKLKASGN
jgi:outer membrane murein-binding lipoprotein Lpp